MPYVAQKWDAITEAQGTAEVSAQSGSVMWALVKLALEMAPWSLATFSF